MAKLMTINIDLNLQAATFDLWSQNMWTETHIYIFNEQFGALNIKIGYEIVELVKLTSTS